MMGEYLGTIGNLLVGNVPGKRFLGRRIFKFKGIGDYIGNYTPTTGAIPQGQELSFATEMSAFAAYIYMQNFGESPGEARRDGLTRYHGKPCRAHPELGGLRTTRQAECVGCRREAARCYAPRRRHDPERIKRYRQAPYVKQKHSLQIKVRQALRKGYIAKATSDWLGYSVDELRSHLLSTVPDGLALGECELDHIKPISAFPRTEQGLWEAWRLDNLRLTTPSANRRKGARVIAARPSV